jgi:hypothetical protein
MGNSSKKTAAYVPADLRSALNGAYSGESYHCLARSGFGNHELDLAARDHITRASVGYGPVFSAFSRASSCIFTPES